MARTKPVWLPAHLGLFQLSTSAQSPLEISLTEFLTDRIERLVDTPVLGIRLRWLGAEQVRLHATLLFPTGQPETDQPHGLSSPIFGAEQVPCRSEDGSVARGPHREGAGSGVGLERAKSDLQRDDRPGESLVTSEKPDLLGRPAQGIAKHRRIDDVLREGSLLRDRLALGRGVDLIAGDPAGLEMELCSRPRPEVPAQLFEGKAPNIADRLQPHALQARKYSANPYR